VKLGVVLVCAVALAGCQATAKYRAVSPTDIETAEGRYMIRDSQPDRKILISPGIFADANPSEKSMGEAVSAYLARHRPNCRMTDIYVFEAQASRFEAEYSCT
jgi:hypothetical protein